MNSYYNLICLERHGREGNDCALLRDWVLPCPVQVVPVGPVVLELVISLRLMKAALQSGAAGLVKVTPPLEIYVSLSMNSFAILLDTITSARPLIVSVPLISLRRGKVSSESVGMFCSKMYPETSVISLKKVKFASVSDTLLKSGKPILMRMRMLPSIALQPQKSLYRSSSTAATVRPAAASLPM